MAIGVSQAVTSFSTWSATPMSTLHFRMGTPLQTFFPAIIGPGRLAPDCPDQAWYIHFGGARVQRGIRANSYLAWPVRGRSEPVFGLKDKPRFQSLGETVQDLATGLEWRKDSDGLGRSASWTEAGSGADRLNRLNNTCCSRWRLPNIRELASLLDMRRHTPALSPNHPFSNLRQAYWSATTSAYDTTYAWVVELKDGAVGVGYKPLKEFYAWYVRCKTD